jgi:hypothetical protein
MSLYLDYMREELDWKDDKVSQENKTAPDLVLLEKHGVPLANPHSIFALELINGLQKLLSVRGALIVVKVMDVLSVLPDSLRVHGMQLEAAGKFDQADWTVLTDTIAEATQALKIRYKFASSRRGSALPSDLSNLVSSSAPITPSPKVGPDVKLQAASSAVYNFNRRTSATKSVTSATAAAGAIVQRSAKRSSTRKSGSNLALPHGSPVRHRPMMKNSESTPELADSVDDDVVPAVDPLRAGYSAFLLSIKAMVKEQPRFCVAATD